MIAACCCVVNAFLVSCVIIMCYCPELNCIKELDKEFWRSDILESKLEAACNFMLGEEKAWFITNLYLSTFLPSDTWFAILGLWQNKHLKE